MFLDTANVQEIQKYKNTGLIKGITTNPTILAREKMSREKQIDSLLHEELPMLFVQLVGESFSELREDFDNLFAGGDLKRQIEIKIPLNFSGLEMIRFIKERHPNKKILGTAIYSADQAIIGALASCDYLAIYVNRMENNNLNPYEAIAQTKKFIDERNLNTRIMGASFKNTNQVIKAFDAGAHTVTIPADILEQMINKELAVSAIHRFNEDGKLNL